MSNWKLSLLKGTLDMIFKHKSLPTQFNIYERMVLIALTNLADIRKGNANIFPSINYLSNVCGCSSRSIQRTLKSLEEKNIIKSVKRNGHSNLYLIELPTPDSHTPPVRESYPPRHTDTHITLPITKTITKKEEFVNSDRVHAIVSSTQKKFSRTYQQVKEKNERQKQIIKNTKIAYPNWNKKK